MAHIHDLYDFTVSFLVVHPTEPKILLHYHKKLSCWNQLGGHIELNENPMEALERELKEEAGLHPEDYEITQTHESLQPRGTVSLPVGFGLFVYDYADSGHRHIDIPYIIKSKKAEIKPAEGESIEIGWFSLEEIKKMNADDLVEDGILDICEWILQKNL